MVCRLGRGRQGAQGCAGEGRVGRGRQVCMGMQG